MNLTAALYQRLAGSTELTDLLAEHPEFAGSPGIYTDDRVPRDAAFPYVWTHGEVANEDWDTKTALGERPTRDVVVYHDHRQTAEVEQIADLVKGLLHRHRLDVDGWQTVAATCTGPVRMSSDDYDARVLTLRLRLTKEP